MSKPDPANSDVPGGHIVGRIVSVESASQVSVHFDGCGAESLPARVATQCSLAELQAACSQERDIVLLRAQQGDAQVLIVMALLAQPDNSPDGQPEELVFRCGKASITLRSDGLIRLQGVRIDSKATRLNRILGGTIQLN